MSFIFGLSIGIALLFFNKRAKAKTRESFKQLHIPKWAMPSDYFGETFNAGNTTTFTGNESPAVPTVPSQFEMKTKEAEPTPSPTDVVITTVIDESEEEKVGMEDIYTLMGVTKKETSTPTPAEEHNNAMQNQSVSEESQQPLVSSLEEGNSTDQVISYIEAELDGAVSAFATSILGLQSVTNNPIVETENNTLNNQTSNGDFAAPVLSVVETEPHNNDGDVLSDYEAYLMSLNQPTTQTDNVQNGGNNVMENKTITAQSKEDKQFFATVHTNLLEAIAQESAPVETLKFEPVVLTPDDWFNGEHEQYVQIDTRYEDIYTHKIIEAASGMQTWVVQILGRQNELIHVSDGTARIWLDVSDFIGKPMDIGSVVMVDVVCAEGTLQVETYSLLESASDEKQVDWNQDKASQYDYDIEIFDEYKYEEQERFVKLA